MRTKDILDGFSKPEVRDIASRLGFVLPAGTPKPEMVTVVARSLGASCGWSGAIDELLGVLQRQELLDFRLRARRPRPCGRGRWPPHR